MLKYFCSLFIVAFWQSLVGEAAQERKCSGHSESGVTHTEVHVLPGQASFLFYVRCHLPLLFSIANTTCFFIFRDQHQECIKFYPNFKLFPVLSPCYPMHGVSVDIAQRTNEFFEQNLAAALAGGKKW